MTNIEDMDVGCCEEELSEIQKEFYEKSLKEYNQAVAEASKLKKDGTVLSKAGNICVVKSAYQVRFGNSATPLLPATGSAPATQIASQKNLQTTSLPAITTSAISVLQGTSMKSAQTLSQPTSQLVVQQNAASISSPAASQNTALISQQQSPAEASSIGPKLLTVVSQQPKGNSQSAPAGLATNLGAKANLLSKISTISAANPASKTPSTSTASSSSVPINVPATKLANENKTPSVQQTKSQQKPEQQKLNNPQGPSMPIAQHTVEMTADDSKLAKSHPSLMVIVKPSKVLSPAVCSKKRETLDGFVKSRLVLTASQFAEWLMQSGLARSKQMAICPLHPLNPAGPLQLGMSREEGKFPHSGGYVWITQCCNKSFVSIFAGSIFENSPHPPTSLLKLIYHWACQTSVGNVIQWVKVDRAYIRLFYGMMRSMCTVSTHTSTPMFGTSKNGRVEVGVISLGTTSADGKRRDVKVEVLGVYDQETQKIRLRASEPVGDARSRTRFAKILEPLPSWVCSQAIILTDFTVDRSNLQELGFQHVVQKTLSTVSTEDRLNNRNIMEYLRRTVPKVFQNTLSLLTTGTIQQFLDELVWRETRGQSAADAFHNMVEDLRIQTAAETGTTLTNRLTSVSADPFKDWSFPKSPPAAPLSQPQTSTQSSTSSTSSAGSSAVKRPAPPPVDTVVVSKVPKTAVVYYANLPPNKQDVRNYDMKACDITCQAPDCRKSLKSNLEIMHHMRQHMNDKDGNEQCIYCLREFATAAQKRQHEITFHESMISFKEGTGKEDSANVKGEMCLICLERFKQHQHLEQHLQSLHVSHEVPYRCRACNFRSSVHTHLVDHFHSQHANSCLLLCPLCLDTFTTKGDGAARGMETGHMQYLTHLRNHENIPMAKKSRCKRCLLTFLQPDQLQHHVRMDHVSMAAHSAVRPLNVTVVTSSTPVSSAPPAPMTSIPTLVPASSPAPAPAPVPAPVPAAASTPTPAPAPAPATVPVPAASPAASTSTSISSPISSTSQKPSSKNQGKVKEAIPGVDSSMVVRRYSNLVLDKEDLDCKTCIECNDEMKKSSHFPAYLCCPSCRFATCCAAAMKKHHDQVHAKDAKQKSGTQFGSVFALSTAVKCQCGLQSKSGLEVGRHLAQCDIGRIHLDGS